MASLAWRSTNGGWPKGSITRPMRRVSGSRIHIRFDLEVRRSAIQSMVRTDRHKHRTVAGDSALAEAVKVPARTHQSLLHAIAASIGGILPIKGRSLGQMTSRSRGCTSKTIRESPVSIPHGRSLRFWRMRNWRDGEGQSKMNLLRKSHWGVLPRMPRWNPMSSRDSKT